jgi:hypothetical protein
LIYIPLADFRYADDFTPNDQAVFFSLFIYSSTQLPLALKIIHETHNRSKMDFNTSTPSFNQSPVLLDLTPELGERVLQMCNNDVEIYRLFFDSPGFSDSFLLSESIKRSAYLRAVLL